MASHRLPTCIAHRSHRRWRHAYKRLTLNALKPVAVQSRRIYLPLKDIKDLNELMPRSQEVAAGGNSAAGTSSRANAGKNLIEKHRHEVMLIAKSTTPSFDVKLGHRWADSPEFMSKFGISWHLVGDDVGLTQRLHAHVGAVVGRLEDEHGRVRLAAMKVMGINPAEMKVTITGELE